MRTRERQRVSLFLWRVILTGLVSMSVGITWNSSQAEEDFPSILLPASPEEAEMMKAEEDISKHSSSAVPESSLKMRRKGMVKEEHPGVQPVDPQQLIFERAVRESRAREARLASRRWYGISSGRPSNRPLTAYWADPFESSLTWQNVWLPGASYSYPIRMNRPLQSP